MSRLLLEGSWVSPDPTGAWQVLPPEESHPVPIYVSKQEVGTVIVAQAIAHQADEPTQSLPFVEQRFDPPLNLRRLDVDGSSLFFAELRFWFRSSRVGDGQSSEKGFYLSFEIANDEGEFQWFIPVKQKNTWELHRLWLGDIPESLLQAVTTFRLQSLDQSQGFQAVLGDVIATTPEPIQDVDAQLLERLDEQFQVAIQNTPMLVPAFVELPENPGDRTLPYILITPWSIQPLGERGSSGDITDNYRRMERVTPDGETIEVMEVAQRPALKQILLEYAIDVFAEDRLQKAQLLDAILADFSRQTYLIINGEPLTLSSFTPSPEQVTEFAAPGRTPIYLQLTVPIEAGDRQFITLAERPVMQYDALTDKLSVSDEPSVTEPERVLI